MPNRRLPLRTGALALAGLLAGAPRTVQAQRRCVVAEVTVSPPDAVIAVDASYQFTVTAYDRAGNPCDNIRFTWTSSNRVVAAIDATGLARGLTPGTTTITARAGVGAAARSNSAAVTVGAAGVGPSTASQVPGFIPRPGRAQGAGFAATERQPDGTGPAENLVVDQSSVVLVRGESQYLDFHPIGRDGSVAAPVPILFTVDSGGANIVQVDSLGLISSRGEVGRALVRLTIPNQVRIQAKLVRVEVRADTIRFNRTEFSMEPGTTETLSVFIPQQSRSLDPGGIFTFRSSDSTKARVNLAQPVVVAVQPGTVQITGQGGGLLPDIIATVHVHQRIASLRLDPADTTRIIAVSDTTQVRATALGADAQPVAEAPLTWSTPDTAVASFDRMTGLVRGRRPGNAVFTVFAPAGRSETIQKTVRVRVVPGSLEAARTRFGLNVGQHEAVDVQLMDEQRRAIRSALPWLTWTSTADTVARIENGQIVAGRPGRARITGRARWDSTVTLDVLVSGDMVAVHQYEARLDLAMYWDGGANWKPLTSDTLLEESPAWSPDLTRLAYVAGPPPIPRGTARSSLYLMNVDGTEATRVTEDTGRVRMPSWVRGGAPRIVFEWSKTGLPQLWLCELPPAVIGPCTSRPITTTAVANQDPGVSPAGDRLVYVSARQTSPGRTTSNIYRSLLDGSGETAVYTAPQGERVSQPTFAPDGRTLYFIRTERGRPATQRVYRLTLGGAPTDTAVAVTPPPLMVRSFSFNADGSALMLNHLEPAPNNRTLSRLQLFVLATGALSAPPTPPGDEVATPALRPAAVPSANR
jgi:uncharacterized protein YjdB